MNHHYGIDTSVFVRLLTGDPEAEYEKTVSRFAERQRKEPEAEFFVSNQVIGEAYIALQHHYAISKPAAKSAMCDVFTSGLCMPLNGSPVLEILQTDSSCGLLDRLISNDYAQCGMIVLTNDLKMSRLPSAQKL